MITVERLTYEYPETKALDDISFTVQEGAITALVGPNGAGKTTLLKCIAGLVKPYSGSISVHGINVLEEPRKSHEIMGFLTDFFGLYDALTVSQSLEYFALAQKLDKSIVKERAAEVAGLLNLTDKLHSRASSLSRGMRQRLAIGQAMVHYPKVLLLDEPSSGLDPEARMSLAELFLHLNAERNMTIIVSSHILAELDQYAKDLLILKNGRILDHTAVTNLSGNKRKVMIRCNGGEQRIAAIVQELETMDTISHVSHNTPYLCLDFSGKDSELSELLHSLINKGIPVVEFFIKREGMQEQYLETMRI
ncbi:MAG: ABC transporter ATP-binding protein [Candidatus Electrothrix sp. AW2]|nr:ABC transporter ATP-binding protein [Candidatus Electrothrix gigas]MCI5134745.1 ABC transporter ATP-binding protein [Candidatus Electrothrix gigas]